MRKQSPKFRLTGKELFAWAVLLVLAVKSIKSCA